MNFEQKLAMALGSKELELLKLDEKVRLLKEENEKLQQKIDEFAANENKHDAAGETQTN